jgi:hypothetical protein
MQSTLNALTTQMATLIELVSEGEADLDGVEVEVSKSSSAAGESQVTNNGPAVEARMMEKVPQEESVNSRDALKHATVECAKSTSQHTPGTLPARTESLPARKIMKVPSYDGKGGQFSAYLMQYEAIAEANAWGDSSKALNMLAALQGAAREHLVHLNEETRKDWRKLVAALRSRFDTYADKRVARVKLKTLRRTKGEDLRTVAEQAERLALAAYPTADDDTRTGIACEAFTAAISGEAFAHQFCMHPTADLWEAYELACHLERSQEGSAQRGGWSGGREQRWSPGNEAGQTWHTRRS